MECELLSAQYVWMQDSTGTYAGRKRASEIWLASVLRSLAQVQMLFFQARGPWLGVIRQSL